MTSPHLATQSRFVADAHAYRYHCIPALARAAGLRDIARLGRTPASAQA